MSVPMAIVDFIPVVLFIFAMRILLNQFYDKMTKGIYGLAVAGAIDVALAGACKALWKLLYAAGICNFEKLSSMFFPLEAAGLLILGIAAVSTAIHLKKEKKGTVLAAAAPAVFTGTAIFVVMMVLGIGAVNFSLAAAAKKMKRPGIVVIFIFAFIGMMAMGYLASKDFELSWMNWLAEAVNTAAWGLFLFGAWRLKKAGLKDFEL